MNNTWDNYQKYNSHSKKRIEKQKILLLAGIILLVVLFIIKTVYEVKSKEYFLEEISANSQYNNMTLIDTWKVSSISLDENEYMSIGKIKMLDISKDFHNMKELAKNTYAFYNEKEQIEAVFIYYETPRFIDSLKACDNDFYDCKGQLYSHVKSYLQKHNFKSDLELYRYLIKNGAELPTKDDSYSTVKEKYITKTISYISNLFSTLSGDFIEIEGRDNIYVVKYNDRIVLFLEAKEKIYRVEIYQHESNYFSEDKIKEIISSMKIG